MLDSDDRSWLLVPAIGRLGPPTNPQEAMMTEASAPLERRWDDKVAAGMSEPELLLYRSHLLGRDKKITNFGGGNTSAKLTMKDPLSGASVEVLWIKGSGGDLGSMGLDGFSTLYLDRLNELQRLYR